MFNWCLWWQENEEEDGELTEEEDWDKQTFKDDYFCNYNDHYCKVSDKSKCPAPGDCKKQHDSKDQIFDSRIKPLFKNIMKKLKKNK
jgi:hypothetical protein